MASLSGDRAFEPTATRKVLRSWDDEAVRLVFSMFAKAPLRGTTETQEHMLGNFLVLINRICDLGGMPFRFERNVRKMYAHNLKDQEMKESGVWLQILAATKLAESLLRFGSSDWAVDQASDVLDQVRQVVGRLSKVLPGHLRPRVG